jgi:hypothetical protein
MGDGRRQPAGLARTSRLTPAARHSSFRFHSDFGF